MHSRFMLQRNLLEYLPVAGGAVGALTISAGEPDSVSRPALDSDGPVCWHSGSGDSRTQAKRENRTREGVILSPIFLVFSASFFCFALMLWVLYAWLPLSLIERFHITMTRSGFLTAVSLQGAAVAGVLLGGFIGDALQNRRRLGRVWTGAAGLLFSAPCFFFIFWSQHLPLVECFSIAFGFFSGLFISNIFAMVFDIVDERRHGSAAAILNGIGGIAGGIGILVSGIASHGLEDSHVLSESDVRCNGPDNTRSFKTHSAETRKSLNPKLCSGCWTQTPPHDLVHSFRKVFG